MLNAPTPFPYVGSYALLEHEGQDQLVRILGRRVGRDGTAFSLIGFPLRDGASGNMEVEQSALIDATPLTAAEAREYHDLDRSLRGKSLKTAKQRQDMGRRDLLRQRMIVAPLLATLMRRLEQRAERRAA